MAFTVGAVVTYCTNDYRYIALCLKELEKYCKEIVVVVSDQFSNGEIESREMLHRTYAEHPHISFIEFKYSEVGLFGLRTQTLWEGQEKARLHISTSRYIGSFYLSEEVDYITFVDVDEIPEGEKFHAFFSKSMLLPDLLYFSSYIYIGNEKQRAVECQYSHLAVKREALQPELLLNLHERPGYFFGFQGTKVNSVRGLDGNPMIHHYSWVRSFEELYKKVTTWGHREDQDWSQIIKEGRLEEILQQPLERVEKTHDLLSRDVEYLRSLEQFVKIPRSFFANVKQTSPKEVRKLDIERMLFCMREMP